MKGSSSHERSKEDLGVNLRFSRFATMVEHAVGDLAAAARRH